MKNLKKAFTLLELLIVIGILAILVVAVLVTLNPAETQKKARDVQRLRDAATLQAMVDQYVSSGGATTAGCLTSTAGCSSLSATSQCTSSWFGGTNLCAFGQVFPVDPVNAARSMASGATVASVTANYVIRVSGSDYEVNVRQESTANASKLTGDGGNNAGWVEYGTVLTLLN